MYSLETQVDGNDIIQDLKVYQQPGGGGGGLKHVFGVDGIVWPHIS